MQWIEFIVANESGIYITRFSKKLYDQVDLRSFASLVPKIWSAAIGKSPPLILSDRKNKFRYRRQKLKLLGQGITIFVSAYMIYDPENKPIEMLFILEDESLLGVSAEVN